MPRIDHNTPATPPEDSRPSQATSAPQASQTPTESSPENPADAKAKAIAARQRALARINRDLASFELNNAKELDNSATFSVDSVKQAQSLIALGDLRVAEEDLTVAEKLTREMAAQEVEPASASEFEARLESVMDAPYFKEAFSRITNLPNPPKSQDECLNLSDNLRDTASANLGKETLRIYVKLLSSLSSVYAEDDDKLSTADDPATPAEILAILSTDDDWSVRYAVAGNINTPASVLTDMAASDDMHVEEDDAEFMGEAMGGNASTPFELLDHLSSSDVWQVRAAVGTNTSAAISDELMNKLADDPRRHVRRAVARNIEAPEHILIKLSQDPEDIVVEAVAGNERTPSNVLADLAIKEDWDLQALVAANSNSPRETLTRLAKSDSPEVRRAVALNLRTPPETLAHMYALEQSEEIVRVLTINPNFTNP